MIKPLTEGLYMPGIPQEVVEALKVLIDDYNARQSTLQGLLGELDKGRENRDFFEPRKMRPGVVLDKAGNPRLNGKLIKKSEAYL